MSKKDDADFICAHIDNLKNSSWIGTARSWWPDFIYHFTDIENAVKIIEMNQLLSREALEKQGLMMNDNASPEIIAKTDPERKNYVRLYFRPRTPTQYANEGFRPTDKLQFGGAHCPIPIYFLFDSKTILCKRETYFSDGSLAAKGYVEISNNYEGLSKIPFNLVYHDGPMYEDKAKIKFHRHAEVIIPDKLDLENLKYIWCRTSAEYETLLNLLKPAALKRWIRKIGVGAKSNLFFREWTFVEEVNMSNDSIVVKFNPTSRSPGPFEVMVEITEENTGIIYTWNSNDYTADDKLTLNLSNLKDPSRYGVKLFLNNKIAFYGKHQAETVPF